MNPIDYSSAFADLPTPSDSFLKGFQGGFAIDQAQAKLQQDQAAQAQQQRQQQVIGQLISNPSAGGEQYANAMLQVPGMSEQLKQAWDTKSAVAQKQQLSDLSQWGMALENKQPQIVVDGLNSRADAIENANDGPTLESKALRAKAQAVKENPQFGSVLIKSMLAVHPQGKAVIDNIVAQNKDARDQNESDSKVAGEATDQRIKNLGVVAQTAGSMAKPGVKISQAQTMFRTLASRGIIPKDDLQGYLDGIPDDVKDLPDYFRQIQASGMKPDDQMKYTTPTADATLSSNTSIKTTGMNNATSIKVQQMTADREAANNAGGDASDFTPSAIDNAAARYNLDGTLPPMGMGKAASAGRTAILNRAAEFKTGIAPEQQRLDQLNNKGDVAARNASVRDYSSAGKSGQAIQAANTSLNHLETVEQLALAQKNGDTRLFNRMANKLSAEFGGTAPTNLNAALSMVAPEVSKAVIGVAGTGEERAAFEHRFAANGSPEQAIQGIGTIKELLGGRLTESQRTYERTTKKTDFDSMLSPAAKRVLDRAQQSAYNGPAVGTVDSGFRFKGGDPRQKANWEPVR